MLAAQLSAIKIHEHHTHDHTDSAMHGALAGGTHDWRVHLLQDETCARAIFGLLHARRKWEAITLHYGQCRFSLRPIDIGSGSPLSTPDVRCAATTAQLLSSNSRAGRQAGRRSQVGDNARFGATARLGSCCCAGWLAIWLVG